MYWFTERDYGGFQVPIWKISQHDGEPGKPMVYFLFEFKGLNTRRANSVSPLWRLSNLRPRKGQCFSVCQKAGKSRCPSSKALRQVDFPLTQPFVLSKPLNDWMRSIHIRENNLLYSVFSQMLISSRNTLAVTSRISRICLSKCLSTLWPQSSWHVKLIITLYKSKVSGFGTDQ